MISMMRKMLALTLSFMMVFSVFAGTGLEAAFAAATDAPYLCSETGNDGQTAKDKAIEAAEQQAVVTEDQEDADSEEAAEAEAAEDAALAEGEEGESSDQEEPTGIDISTATVTLSQTEYTYDGTYHRPEVTVVLNEETLVEDYDYTTLYTGNQKAGTAKITITGIGEYSGTTVATFTIKRKALTNFWFNGAGSSADTKTAYYLYNGQKKDVQIFTRKQTTDDYGDTTYTYIKLKKGTDYSISFPSGRKTIGKHKAVVTFKGNYSGKVTKQFRILPKDPTNVRLTNRTKKALTFKWNRVKGAAGYKITVFRDGDKKNYVTKKGYSNNKIVVNRKYAFEGSVLIKVYAYKKVNGTIYKSKVGTYGKNEYYKPGKASYKLTRSGFGEITLVFPKYTYYQVIVKNKDGETVINDRVWTSKGKEWYVRNLESGERYTFRIREYAYNTKGNIMVGKWTVKTVIPY